MLIREWFRLRDADPNQAGRVLATMAARAAWRVGASRQDVEDVAQETVCRFLRATTLGRVRPSVPLSGWLRTTARNVRLEFQRTAVPAPRPRNPRPRVPFGTVEPSLSGLTAVEASASLREWSAECLRVISLLPAPYRQIGSSIYTGATLREISVYLSSWRGVGIDESRRLYRRTKRMVRAAMWGDPQTAFVDAYDPKKNPWLNTPPPPVSSS